MFVFFLDPADTVCFSIPLSEKKTNNKNCFSHKSSFGHMRMNSDEERTEIDRSMRDFGFHVAACVKSAPGNVFFFSLY